MNENETKRTFKQEIKDWWDENKRVIKAGVTCGLLGLAYGFIKGGLTVANMRYKYARSETGYVEQPEGFEYTEENVDDPELLELIRLEEESE